MRVGALLLLAAVATAGPFDPPPKKRFQAAVPDGYARYAESFALLKERLAASPAELASLERLAGMLERFGRAPEAIPLVRTALQRDDLAEKQRAGLRALLGHLLVLDAGAGNVRVIRIGVGGRRIEPGLSREARSKLTEAVGHLRAALRALPESERGRTDLANALERLDEEANKLEVRKLRLEAGALAARRRVEPPKPVQLDAQAGVLRLQAEELERKEPPEHAAALLLRRKALVLDFCTHTVPFDYEPPVYAAASLLAPRGTVNRNLTRTYRTRAGEIETVRPQYYGATAEQKRDLIDGLARDAGAPAAAILLKLAMTGHVRDTLADAALDALVDGRHAAAIEHLPRLLEIALVTPSAGTRRLVALARSLGVREAAPVLAKHVARDDDLDLPFDAAAALGAVGEPGHADALVAVARDPARDVYFRRQAILALGRLAPDRLADVPDEPYLALARAAAQYRAEATDRLEGRVLSGIGRPHETDDAARYCVDLDIREAIPSLESFLAANPDHYAAGAAKAALETLVRRTRGGE